MYISAALINRADTIGVAISHQTGARPVFDNCALTSIHPRLDRVGADISPIGRLVGVNLMDFDAKLSKQVGKISLRSSAHGVNHHTHMRGANGIRVDKRCHRSHIVGNDICRAVLPLKPQRLGGHRLLELFDDILVGRRAITHPQLEA